MPLKLLISFSLLGLFPTLIISGQSTHPIKTLQKDNQILTLSNGQYEEFFDQDSIQQIGSALVNVNSMQVVKLLNEEESARLLDKSSMHRFLSLDPLTISYPMLTPYQFSSNNPVLNIDLDGSEGVKYTNHKDKTITVIVDINYVLKKEGQYSPSNVNLNQLDRIQSNLNSELNSKQFKDEVTGYNVEFAIVFTPTTTMVANDRFAASNEDIQDPGMFLIMKNETVLSRNTVTDKDGNTMTYTATEDGNSNWRILRLTSSRRGHTMVHELFHNLIHNHKNAPADLKSQIDPKNQKAGHKAATGIFIYEDATDGDKEEGLSQKNIQDMLKSLPERTFPTQTLPHPNVKLPGITTPPIAPKP